jgi:peptidyl-prolyl cis-trans isomerase D
MPSREMRRATRRHQQRDGNIVEKKRETHPFLYAFSVVLLIVIVVTFIGGPALSRSGGGGRIVFGYYKDKPIEFVPGNYFARRVNDIADRMREGTQDNSNIRMIDVWRAAFDQTLEHVAVLDLMENSGVWVSDDKVNGALIKSGPYMVDGKFSVERFNSTSKVDQMRNMQLYRELLTVNQFYTDVLQGLRESPLEMQFLTEMLDEQRRFSLVSFPFSDFPEDQVTKYAEENRERFRRIKLSRILIKSSEREADEIRAKLVDRTGSFAELAREHSTDIYADKGGDMGWRYYYDLEADFEDTAPVETIFQLQETEISPVLESRFGWVIFRCDSPALEPDFDVEETRQVVRNYLMRYEKGIVEDYTLSVAEAFHERVGDVGFLGATLEANYTVGMTDYFPINFQSYYYLTPVRSITDQIDISSAAFSEEFFIRAFSLGQGEVSSPILLDDQVVVLRLDDVRAMPERQRQLVDAYYSNYAPNFLDLDLRNALLDPKLIKDNFDAVFRREFTSRQ